MPGVRCPVCGGSGTVGQYDKTCPECQGKGYVYEPQWSIDREREQSQDRKEGDKYILLRERKPKLKYKAPDFGCFVIVLIVICGLAWIFTIFASWEQYPWLKWLCIVPLPILLLISLPDIIRKVRKKREYR